MFAKLQKHKQRKSKQQLKFKFEVYDFECFPLPRNIFSCRILLTRGAKVSMSGESSVETTTMSDNKTTTRAVFYESSDANNKLTQIVTLYREENGQFEPKAYNVKLQSVGNSTTFARGTLDASKFINDMQALSEGGFESAHEMRMDNGTHIRCKVRMTWLKNATTKGSRRGSEMDLTELSFISSANLSASFVANNNIENENDNSTNPFMTTPINGTGGGVLNNINEEQDLSGFDEELGVDATTTTTTTTPVSSTTTASSLRKFNTSEVKRSLSTTSYLSPIGECSTPELANNRADTLIANSVSNEEAIAREKALAEQQRQTTLVLESLRKEARDLRRRNDELTRDRDELETQHEEETEKLKSKIDAMRDELRAKEEGQKEIERSALESSRALEMQTRKLERLEADFAQAKNESLGLKEQTQSLEAALVALRNKQEEKKANDENIAVIDTNSNNKNKNKNSENVMATSKYEEDIAALKSTLEKKEKQIIQLERVVKTSAEEISREREKTDAMVHKIESERDSERNAYETEITKCETEIDSLKSQLVSVVQETTMLATDLRKDLQKRADKEIRDANEEAMKAREELDRTQKELDETNVSLHSHVAALVDAKTESAVAQGEVLELRLSLRKTKEKLLESLARLTRFETKDVMRRAAKADETL